MYVRASRPAFDWPYAGVHRSTSLTISALLLKQCPACLVRLAWIVLVIGGRWPYSWCLVGCCCQDLFNIDKLKRSFFKAAVVSILLYGCTTWTLTKRLKKQDGNYTRMLRAILNKSWRQHHTRHQLYGHLPLMTKTIQVRRTRHAGRDRKWCTPVDPRIWPIKSWTTIGRSGERGSGISVLAARHDDDGDDGLVLWHIKHRRLFNAKSILLHIYIYIVLFQTVHLSISTV